MKQKTKITFSSLKDSYQSWRSVLGAQEWAVRYCYTDEEGTGHEVREGGHTAQTLFRTFFENRYFTPLKVHASGRNRVLAMRRMGRGVGRATTAHGVGRPAPRATARETGN